MVQFVQGLLSLVIAFGPLAWACWECATMSGESQNDNAIWFIFLGALWLVVLIGVSSKKKRDREAAIIKHGKRASARVVSLTPMNTSSDRGPDVRIELEVTPTDEPAFRAIVETNIHVVYIPLYQPEKIVSVFYMPDKKELALEPR